VSLLVAALLAAPLVVFAQEANLYVAGPNDVLSVSIYGQAQLTGKYPVEADGTFTFPCSVASKRADSRYEPSKMSYAIV
jgi:polysaccharide export outer membrane protein